MLTRLNICAGVVRRLLCGYDAIVLWCCVPLLLLSLAVLVDALSSVFAFFFPFPFLPSYVSRPLCSLSVSMSVPPSLSLSHSLSLFSLHLLSGFPSPCCLATPPFPALTLFPLIPYTRNLMYLYALLISFPHRCDLATLYGTL